MAQETCQRLLGLSISVVVVVGGWVTVGGDDVTRLSIVGADVVVVMAWQHCLLIVSRLSKKDIKNIPMAQEMLTRLLGLSISVVVVGWAVVSGDDVARLSIVSAGVVVVTEW